MSRDWGSTFRTASLKASVRSPICCLGGIARIPVAPQFVAQLPQEAAALVCPMFIDILHPICGLLGRTGAEVQGDLRLGVDEFAKAKELVSAEGVVLRNSPGKIQLA